MIKAIFFDIDGTLVSFKTHTIPNATLKALEELRQKGVLLFLSTGRHRSMVSKVYEAFPFDGMISANGQYGEDRNGVFLRDPLPEEEVKAVVEQLEKEPLYTCVFEDENRFFFNRDDQAARDFTSMIFLDAPPVDRPSSVLGKEVFQLVVFLTKENEDLMLEKMPSCQGVRWTPKFMDVYGKSGGKERGIAAVCKKYGIDRSETMAFGDGENDITMFDHVGISVAMGNGSDLVKSKADYVTADVDSDGVRKALQHFGVLE